MNHAKDVSVEGQSKMLNEGHKNVVNKNVTLYSCISLPKAIQKAMNNPYIMIVFKCTINCIL